MYEIPKELLDYVDVDKANSDGQTALMRALLLVYLKESLISSITEVQWFTC